MTFTSGFRSATKAAAILVCGALVLAVPAVANNGNGNGKGNGNSGNGNQGNASQQVASQPNDQNGLTARALGKLNGFMHASPEALAHASPNSEIGKVAIVYAGLLENYLNPPSGTTPPTLQDIAAALAAASNKPLSPEIIAAVDGKLATVNTSLATAIDGYPPGSYASGAEALAADIYAAM
jgi:hypothetical protein